MTDKLNIAIFQTDIIWESPTENLAVFNDKLKNIDEDVDLIVMPEMFATGFTNNVNSVKQTMDGEVVSWMKDTAIKHNTAIFGSVIIEEQSLLFNRAIFTFPNGNIEYYDKKHLFSLAGEDKFFNSGNTRKIINYKGWKIMPQVCYDLRFPIWSRNNLDYDLLIYIASWPEKRSLAWQTLLKARAIENMSYVIGVNRIGTDGNNIAYSGDSSITDSMGIEISDIPKYKDCIYTATLDKNIQNQNRKRFAFLDDRDNFEIID